MDLCFFSSEDEPPSGPEPDQRVLSVSGIRLCWVCGCPGNKACSRCHAVNYCGKHHQTLHWKTTHKRECCTPGLCFTCQLKHISELLRFKKKKKKKILFLLKLRVDSCHNGGLMSVLRASLSDYIEASIVTTSSFLFPESELVIEPEEEEEEEEDTKEAEEEKEGEDCPPSADSKPCIISHNYNDVVTVTFTSSPG